MTQLLKGRGYKHGCLLNQIQGLRPTLFGHVELDTQSTIWAWCGAQSAVRIPHPHTKEGSARLAVASSWCRVSPSETKPRSKRASSVPQLCSWVVYVFKLAYLSKLLGDVVFVIGTAMPCRYLRFVIFLELEEWADHVLVGIPRASDVPSALNLAGEYFLVRC